MNFRSPLGPAALLSCMVLSACVSTPRPADGGPPDASSSIGWLHGRCIALTEASVEAGTGVVVVTLDDAQQVVQARISRRAVPDDGCPAFIHDRRAVSVGSGLSFYLVEPMDADVLAIGVLAQEPLQAPDAVLDTDDDGRRDSFGHCATGEGVRFFVKTDASDTGEPLWNGYYYLGYDVEADCPDDDG